MWIMTRYGFISAVAVDEPGYDLQVRARDDKTLRDIRTLYIPDGQASEIVALPDRDYQYRFYTTRSVFADVLAQMAMEVDYPNFKDTLRGRLHDLASELWWVIFQHYQPRQRHAAKNG